MSIYANRTKYKIKKNVKFEAQKVKLKSTVVRLFITKDYSTFANQSNTCISDNTDRITNSIGSFRM